MAIPYDKYYLTENLFGNPYPELMAFFERNSSRGKVLDLGCGQGRDSIPLARIGYQVTGIDNSKVGIKQMNRIAEKEGLPLKGEVYNIYEFDNFEAYDIILLDSMFHFTKIDIQKEKELICKIISNCKKGCLIVFCIQNTGKKVDILNTTIDYEKQLDRHTIKRFEYVFEDKESGHTSKTDYQMIVVKK